MTNEETKGKESRRNLVMREDRVGEEDNDDDKRLRKIWPEATKGYEERRILYNKPTQDVKRRDLLDGWTDTHAVDR